MESPHEESLEYPLPSSPCHDLLTLSSARVEVKLQRNYCLCCWPEWGGASCNLVSSLLVLTDPSARITTAKPIDKDHIYRINVAHSHKFCKIEFPIVWISRGNREGVTLMWCMYDFLAWPAIAFSKVMQKASLHSLFRGKSLILENFTFILVLVSPFKELMLVYWSAFFSGIKLYKSC